jgi:hypothetical protein
MGARKSILDEAKEQNTRVLRYLEQNRYVVLTPKGYVNLTGQIEPMLVDTIEKADALPYYMAVVYAEKYKGKIIPVLRSR